jgi:hypothetical protein
MEHKKLNRIIAGVVFLISIIVLVLTTQNSVPFWDCAEVTASSFLLQVPHPPGAPFHALLGRIFLMIPFLSDIAFRLNFMSALAGALTVMMVYLSSVILIKKWRGSTKTLIDKIVVYGSSAVGALCLSFSDTFWFNAVESTVFSHSLFLLSFVVWLALHWWTVSDKEEKSERLFLLIGYLFGISIGVHQLSLLAFFTVALIYYFKKYDVTKKSFLIFSIVCASLFVVMYKGVLIGIPGMLETPGKKMLLCLIVAAIIYGLYYAQKHHKGILNLGLLFIVLMVIGYSTYMMIVIRANKGLAMNENNPDSIEKLVSYLGREQYGDWPIVNFDKTKWGGKLLPRRWTDEAYRAEKFKEYSSDWDYFVSYQFYNMWFRYLLWNYVGRAGDIQDAPPAFTGKADEKWIVGEPGHNFPNRYYAIPFILGLIGAIYHLYKDKKLGFSIWVLFIVTGFGLMFYQNMQNPQPRERDYFFVGSFYVYAIWIGIGIAAILEMLEKSKSHLRENKTIYIGILAILLVAAPGNMLYQNYDDHNRHDNYLAWDFAYNLLQSCPKDAILITNGDNDTFPIWYIQDVEGVRRDVRLVNLSLINTDWYTLQMKNETPYNSKKVPMTYSDDQIKGMINRFHEWPEAKQINLPVSKEVYKQFLNEEFDNVSKDFKTTVLGLPKSVSDTADFPGMVNFAVKAAYSVPDGRGQTHYGVRSQDLFVLDIIKTNNWVRPVCFSITCSPDSKLGLDNYLRMEGLTYRLTPFKNASQSDFINPREMWEHLMKEPDGFSKEPAYGFKFRNLNNPNAYLDENALRLAQNYRSVFMNLASYFINNTPNKEKALAVINMMERKIGVENIPLDYRMKYNLALFYDALDQRQKFDDMAKNVEADCLKKIEINPMDVNGPWNPYRVLMDVYELSKQYDKELGLLHKLEIIFPQAGDIKQKVDQIQKLKNGISPNAADSVK